MFIILYNFDCKTIFVQSDTFPPLLLLVDLFPPNRSKCLLFDGQNISINVGAIYPGEKFTFIPFCSPEMSNHLSLPTLDYSCLLDPKETFHALVRRYFHGALKPPFNAEKRAEAGIPPDFYWPLAES